MSHETEPNAEAEGGPENDKTLPDAILAPVHTNPAVGDDSIPDEPPDEIGGEVHLP